MTIIRRNNKIDELDIENIYKDDTNPKISNKIIKNDMLETAEYKGLYWSDENLHDKALILWDLDQGSWNKTRFNIWIERVENMVNEKFNIERCCHFGALNCNVPSRKNWRKLFSAFDNKNCKGWKVFNKNFKIEVVECRKQAVDQRLVKYSKDLIDKGNKPSLIVIISHDNDMIPILNLAESKRINNMVIRWRKIRNNCKIENATKHSIRVDKETCELI